MEDIFGATFAALAGVVVCAAGCVALRPTVDARTSVPLVGENQRARH